MAIASAESPAESNWTTWAERQQTTITYPGWNTWSKIPIFKIEGFIYTNSYKTTIRSTNNERRRSIVRNSLLHIPQNPNLVATIFRTYFGRLPKLSSANYVRKIKQEKAPTKDWSTFLHIPELARWLLALPTMPKERTWLEKSSHYATKTQASMKAQKEQEPRKEWRNQPESHPWCQNSTDR